MEFVSKKLHWDFIGKWPIAVTLSVLLTIGSFWLWFEQGEAKYGVDFRGGHDILVKVGDSANSETIREALTKHEVPDAIVQAFEAGSQQFSIRLGGEQAEGTSEIDRAKIVRGKVETALKTEFPTSVEILRTDYVGPTVGKELRTKALIATMLGLIGILIYLTVRFEFAFAFGAVIAVFHDVIMTTGFYLLAGFQINMSTIAAALTILGYSVHDTIVIFDRVREEIYKRKEFNLVAVMNDAINTTMSRTIITSMLTLFSVGALLIFGGGSLADLSFYLFVGTVCGTYSTVYIASPVVLAWDYLRNRRAHNSAQQPA